MKVLTRLMLGRVLSSGEEYLVFHFFVKSKVCQEQLQMSAGSNQCYGFWVMITLGLSPCGTICAYIMKSGINQGDQQIHLLCVQTFCVALLPFQFQQKPLQIHQQLLTSTAGASELFSASVPVNSIPQILGPYNSGVLPSHQVHHSENNNQVELHGFISPLLIQSSPHHARYCHRVWLSAMDVRKIILISSSPIPPVIEMVLTPLCSNCIYSYMYDRSKINLYCFIF